MTGRPVVALVGALETKGAAYEPTRDLLLERGCEPLLVDTGVRGEPRTAPDGPAAAPRCA